MSEGIVVTVILRAAAGIAGRVIGELVACTAQMLFPQRDSPQSPIPYMPVETAAPQDNPAPPSIGAGSTNTLDLPWFVEDLSTSPTVSGFIAGISNWRGQVIGRFQTIEQAEHVVQAVNAYTTKGISRDI